jgi:hypothetical protein
MRCMIYLLGVACGANVEIRTGGELYENCAAMRSTSALEVLCVVSESGQDLRYSIVNVSQVTIRLPKYGVPFRMNRIGATHLVVLCDGRRIPSVLEDSYEIGIPRIEELGSIVLRPGEATSGSVGCDRLLRRNVAPGRYDMAGIWRVQVLQAGRQTELSVPIPLISVDVRSPGQRSAGPSGAATQSSTDSQPD